MGGPPSVLAMGAVVGTPPSQNDAADGHARPLFAEALGNGALDHA